MVNKKIARILRGFAVTSGIIGGLFFFWYMPLCIDEIITGAPEVAFLGWPAKIGMFIIAFICYFALYHFLKICTHIENENSFCFENVVNMKIIGSSALVVALLTVLGDVYLLITGWLHPGIIIASFFFIFIVLSFTVISYALSYLIDNAVKIKEENDLTI